MANGLPIILSLVENKLALCIGILNLA